MCRLSVTHSMARPPVSLDPKRKHVVGFGGHEFIDLP